MFTLVSPLLSYCVSFVVPVSRGSDTTTTITVFVFPVFSCLPKSARECTQVVWLPQASLTLTIFLQPLLTLSVLSPPTLFVFITLFARPILSKNRVEAGNRIRFRKTDDSTTENIGLHLLEFYEPRAGVPKNGSSDSACTVP